MKKDFKTQLEAEEIQEATPATKLLKEELEQTKAKATKKVCLRIDTELYKTLKRIALESETTIQALVIEAVEHLTEKEKYKKLLK